MFDRQRHMENMRLRRENKRLKSSNAAEQYSKLKTTWDTEHGFRHGDRARSCAAHEKGEDNRNVFRLRCGRRKHIHKNKWMFTNVMRECWNAIGRRTSSVLLASVGHTTRVLDVIVGCMCLMRTALYAAQVGWGCV